MQNQKDQKNKTSAFKFIATAMFLLISFIVVVYLLDLISLKNKFVCEYMGKLWFDEKESQNHQHPLKGCYAYEQFYEQELKHKLK